MSPLASMIARESRMREREAARITRRIEQETHRTRWWPADKGDCAVCIAAILGGLLLLVAELTGRLG